MLNKKLARTEGFEPSATVLETVILTPKLHPLFLW